MILLNIDLSYELGIMSDGLISNIYKLNGLTAKNTRIS